MDERKERILNFLMQEKNGCKLRSFCWNEKLLVLFWVRIGCTRHCSYEWKICFWLCMALVLILLFLDQTGFVIYFCSSDKKFWIISKKIRHETNVLWLWMVLTSCYLLWWPYRSIVILDLSERSLAVSSNTEWCPEKRELFLSKFDGKNEICRCELLQIAFTLMLSCLILKPPPLSLNTFLNFTNAYQLSIKVKFEYN